MLKRLNWIRLAKRYGLFIRMKRIVVSQRIDSVLGRKEKRDCLDVQWAKLLFDLGYLPIPVCSELAFSGSYIKALQPDGILLSGGNDLGEAPMRDSMESALLAYARSTRVPVLGVCRGMQMVNNFLGGALVEVSGHVAVQHKLQGDWASKNGFCDVNSFHNHSIVEATLAADLFVLATSKDGVVEAVKHKALPWLGIMWHPERELPFRDPDKALIQSIFG